MTNTDLPPASRGTLRQKVRDAVYALERAAAWLILRLTPQSVLRILHRGWLDRLLRQDPEQAMRDLLKADSTLTIRINEAAIRYGNGVHVKHRMMRYHDFFTERIASSETVLDIGCGNGALAHSIAEKTGARVTAIDNCPERLAEARARHAHPRLTFLDADATTWSADSRYDSIVLSNVLEHIAERTPLLRHLTETTSARRYLIRVPMFNRDWRIPLRKELGLPYFSDNTHRIEYTEEDFRREMRVAGLRILHLQINWGEIWAELAPAEEDPPA